ncbi:MAG TPA: ABC transporter substrate-binding protein [Polyangiales bacterium]|nr:ABC transporter substrate-binding protein [Polyangiales bacterium]
MVAAFSHRWVVIAMLLAATACKRGQPHADGAPGQRETTPVTKQALQDGWQQGKLPASVLEGKPQRGGELVVGVEFEPASLNTILSSDWIAKKIAHTRVYESLVRVDANDDPRYAIVPQLAERWEITPDGRVYTFHLRHDVRWHDGKAFSARDVIATFTKLQDPLTLAASTRADFAELEAFSAPDDYTVVLTWKRPYFLVLDAIAELPIQPAHMIEALSAEQYNQAADNPLNRAPIGTGPFKFVEWESSSKIALERNPAYWGRPAYLDRLIFRIVGDATVRMQLAERGEIQLLHRVKSDQWMSMGSPELRAHWNRSRFYAATYEWIGWNQQRSFFADTRVRRALTMLVDRPGIIDKLLYGLMRPTTCHFYWASAACDPDQEPLPYNPSAAIASLDAADIKDHDGDGVRDRKGRAFRFTLSVPSSSRDAGRVAAKIKEDLARSGIDMQIERVEWSAFLKRMNEHDFDATMLMWGGDARMDPTQVWHSSSIDGGSNFISYRNSEINRLIEQARVTLNADARNVLYRKFGAILHAEQPYTFLYVRPELDLLHERVKGARPNLYWWQFEDMWLAPLAGDH